MGTAANAQGNSVLLGTVTDAASGKKISEVVVTATSTATQEPQIAITDSSGYYRIPGLPPGRYSIRIEREGYRPYSRSDLEVSLDRQYRVNIAAQPESMSSEEITITGLPPIIDIGSVNQGAVVNSKFTERMPLVTLGNTNFTAVAGVAPQASTDAAGISFSGATSPENSYTIDGVSVRNNQTGANSGIVPIGFIDQTNIITAGFQAEVGRTTGGAIRAVTRSGSNEFRGEVWTNYMPGGMLPMSKPIHPNASPFVSQTLLWNSIDINATLGGPILKDRIWFFVGFNPSHVRRQQRHWLQAFKLNGEGTGYLFDAEGNRQYTNIEGTRRTRFQENMSLPYIAKLTFLLATNHTLTFSVNGTYESSSLPYSLIPRGSADILKWDGGNSSLGFNNTLLLQYQGSFLDKRLLAQGQVSWFRSSSWSEFSDSSTIQDRARGSATGTPVMQARYADTAGSFLAYNDIPWLSRFYDDATRARIADACLPSIVGKKKTQRCPLTNSGAFAIGGAGFLRNSVSDTVQGTFSLTYLLQFLGHHVWKAGVDYEWLRYDVIKSYSGGFVYDELIANKLAQTYVTRGLGYLTGPDQVKVVDSMSSAATSHQIAWYLQDSWSIMDMVTLNAGIRFDNQQMLNNDGAISLTLNNQIAPRLSLIWDPTQKGRSKVFASYGRYFESVPLSMGDRSFNGDPQFRTRPSTLKSDGCDPVHNFGSVYTTCPGGANEVVKSKYDEPNLSKKFGFPGTAIVPIDPELQPQSSDEITAGAEYEVFRDARIAASYTRRWMNYVVEDLSVDEGGTYFISNPGYGLASSFPKAVRNYNAVTGQFTKAFSSGWHVQASYTWMTLTGNYEGLISSLYGQTTDANITGAFDLRSLLINAEGRLPGNQTHTIKFYGGKEFELGKRFALGIYLSYRGRSGTPINYMGGHVGYGANSAYALPMGSGGELPWLHNLDIMLSANVRLAGGMNLQFRIDALNFINLQGVTSVSQTFTSAFILPYEVPANANPQLAACIAGIDEPSCAADSLPVQKSLGSNLKRSEINPNFKTPTGFQSPFTARFSIRLTF